MAGFGVGVITGDGRHELRFIKLNARIAEHLIDRLYRLRGHHRRGADLINLQNSRRVAGTEGGDAGAQALFVVAFVYRNNFVVRVGCVETLRQ